MVLDSVKEANKMVTYFDEFNYLSNKVHVVKDFIKHKSGVIAIRLKNQCYFIGPECKTIDYKYRPAFYIHKHLELDIDKSKVEYCINCNQKEDEFENNDDLQFHAYKSKFHNSPKCSPQNHGNKPTNISQNTHVCYVYVDVPKVKRGTMKGRKLFNCFVSANVKYVDYLNIWNNDDEIINRFTNYVSHKKFKSK